MNVNRIMGVLVGNIDDGGAQVRIEVDGGRGYFQWCLFRVVYKICFDDVP